MTIRFVYCIIVMCMKVPATLRFITCRDSREELCVEGYAEFGKDAAVIGYTAYGYSLTAQLSADTATVTRSGEDGYEMTFVPGEQTFLSADGFSVPVTTASVMFKAKEDGANFKADYYLGGDTQKTTVIIHARQNKH